MGVKIDSKTSCMKRAHNWPMSIANEPSGAQVDAHLYLSSPLKTEAKMAGVD